MRTNDETKTASGNAPKMPRVYTQVEQQGDYFYARVRSRDSVYLWSVFLSEADAHAWNKRNLAAGIAEAQKDFSLVCEA